jgi:nucleotide-binding universal stress UspA family protein
MKNVLLLVHDDAGQEARFQAALDVTRALDGHLTCVDVTRPPIVVANTIGGSTNAVCIDLDRESEARNRVVMQERLANEQICWSWQDFTGSFVEGVAQAAGMADLIVLNRKLDGCSTPDMRGVTSDVIMRAHKPVLAVPASLNGFRAGGRALIAWDGSDAVSTTLRACIPLLQLASSVRLFSAETYKSDTDLNEPASYLSRHGIHPDTQHVYDERRTAAEAIMDECALWGADWCLMGAYGHNRVREALIGGVTRRLLSESPVPLVLGH